MLWRDGMGPEAVLWEAERVRRAQVAEEALRCVAAAERKKAHEHRMARAARIARCRAHIHVLKECVAQEFYEATAAGVVLGVADGAALRGYFRKWNWRVRWSR